MMAAGIFLMLIPPPLPPSGPVWGRIECLLGTGTASESASIRFNEAGIDVFPSMLGNAQGQKHQVTMIGIPVDGNAITDVEFAADQSIVIYGNPGRRILGKFDRVKSAVDSRVWMDFSVPGQSDELRIIGRCITDVQGRLDRPVRLTEIMTIRVD